MHMTSALRRPWGSPVVHRALLLSGLAAGLWLAGSATSSAAADVPPPAAPVQGIADLTGGLLAPVTTAVAPVVEPVVDAAVVPIAQTLAPVLSPVVDPVVAPLRPALAPVLRPVAVLAPVPAEPAATVVDSPSALDALVLVPIGGSAAVSVPTAGSDTRTGAVEQMTGASLDAPAPVPGGRNVPVPGPALPSGAPAPAMASGPSSPDQHAADLPPAVTGVDLVALGAAADGARDAAADRALDPSFAPD
ncbi:hypothetical protein SAMN05660748_3034 [Blastococcus aggregatus]|uniref:Meckel syndrome type 1 protein n=1 Tax=Blastococcus aggregatus TaxID=38502 RepID=A0A285V9L9_9ACTN|nr:hypothetical protein [Blastococcus aggregatus]SOC50288.1 hypothetical protein SAMN05660748_3034 [Blastococcus aggregatus]